MEPPLLRTIRYLRTTLRGHRAERHLLWYTSDASSDFLASSGPALPEDIVSVQGVRVHESVAAEVGLLLDAAEADDIDLNGYGYRTNTQQLALRRRYCRSSDYELYEKLPSECSPPTARPGSSRHQAGLAIDFTYRGRIITSRSSPAFEWLDENAGRFGLRNLPTEPWHWSVDGR